MIKNIDTFFISFLDVKYYVLKETGKQNNRREELLSKMTSDVHACDEISSISPKNVTSHFKYYTTNI